jgi:hypothetical protein
MSNVFSNCEQVLPPFHHNASAPLGPMCNDSVTTPPLESTPRPVPSPEQASGTNPPLTPPSRGTVFGFEQSCNLFWQPVLRAELVPPVCGKCRNAVPKAQLTPALPNGSCMRQERSVGLTSTGREMRTVPVRPAALGGMISSLPWCVSMIFRVTVNPSPKPTLRVV